MSNDPTAHELTPVDWMKSSRSISTGACVEVAAVGNLIAVRDSKNPAAAPLYYTLTEFDAFLFGVKQGEFDHLLRRA